MCYKALFELSKTDDNKKCYCVNHCCLKHTHTHTNTSIHTETHAHTHTETLTHAHTHTETLTHAHYTHTYAHLHT